MLRRHGCSRLRDLDRAIGVPVQYVPEPPGDLLHLDMAVINHFTTVRVAEATEQLGLDEGIRGGRTYELGL